MVSRRAFLLFVGLTMTLIATGSAEAQSVAYSDAAAPPRVALASAYHLKLESAWPQAAAGDACRNGGDELVEGTLRLGADGVYRGSFDRRTLLLFCGAHGASGEACELTLEGEGKVAMTGYAVSDETSSSGSALRLSWQPSPAHGAIVRGACSADFKRSVEEMYLSVPHGVELPVPAGGEGGRRERLENYAWIAEMTGQ
jgi:hypothetical protein